MSAHTLFKCEGLVDAGEHIGVVSLALVVIDEPTLPQWRNSFNALELVRLFALVAGHWELVAAKFTLPHKFIEDGVLHKIRLHIPAHGDTLSARPFVEVVTPAHHSATEH